MTAETTAKPAGLWRRLWKRKWLVIVPIVVSTVTTMIVARLQPERYRSEASILVAPQVVDSSYVTPLFASSVEERVHEIAQQIVTRARLERIMRDLNIHQTETDRASMEDIVDRMRQGIAVQDVNPHGFRISFTDGDPGVVAKVTNKLAQIFVDESVKDRTNRTDASLQFLSLRIEIGKKSLAEIEAQMDEFTSKNPRRKVPEALSLEFDVAREHYKGLLVKQQELTVIRDLERRNAAESFRLLDAAKPPLGPIGLSRGQLNATGAAIGLGIGLLMLMLSSRRRAEVTA